MTSLAAVTSPRTWARYVRVSRVMGREGEAFRSPDQQRDDMEAWIASRPGDAAGPEFTDLDASGKTLADRDKVQSAITWVLEDPERRGLLVAYQSRAARNAIELWVLWDQLTRVGALLATAESGVMEKDWPAWIQSMIDEKRREEASKGWKRTVQQRFEQGLHHGATPTGYRVENRRLVEDPVTGPVVRELFRRYAAGERTGSLIAYVSHARGRDFSLNGLRRVVTNRTYLGLVELNGEWRPGAHPALVDEETFERCQARRRKDSVTPSRAKEKKSLLGGIAFCGHCGGPLIRTSGNYGPVLVCSQHTTRGRALRGRRCESGIGSPQERLVLDAILTHLELWGARDESDEERFRELQEVAAARHEDVGSAEARLVKSETAISNLVADRYSGDLSTEEYTAALSRLRGRRDRAVADLDVAREALSAAESAAGLVLGRDQRRMVQTVVEAWPDADLARRRAILETWIRRIEVEHRPSRATPLINCVAVWFHGQKGAVRPSGLSEDVLWPVGMRLNRA